MRIAGLLAMLMLLTSCATHADTPADYPEARMYESNSNAAAALAQASVRARENKQLVLAVFGANWCHDSRAMAGWLESEGFSSVRDEYRVVYIDSGTPQTGEGRNLKLAARYGVTDITGTPTVLVIDPLKDAALNATTARTWRNAASRDGDAIRDALMRFVMLPDTVP
ncbi:MAG: thioredoxin family protein [Parerythrobacter sp.]